MKKTKVSYMLATDCAPGYYFICRMTEGDSWLHNDAWNSKDKEWKSDELSLKISCGAFSGFEDDVRPASEQEVKEILAKFGETLQPYVYEKDEAKQTVA